MKPPITQMIRASQPGSHGAIEGHMARASQISKAISARWGIKRKHPFQWKLKHVRWYLQEKCREKAAATRYDHWRTVRVLLSVMGKRRDWEPRLKGSWCYRTGKPGNGHPGGRPPKLPHRS